MSVSNAVTWNEQPGLYQAILAAGYSIVHYSTYTWANNPTAVQAIIDAYNPLAFVQQQQIALVKAQLATVIAAGFTYSGVLVAIDDDSQRNITAMAAIASNIIAGMVTIPWSNTYAWLPKGSGATLPLTTPQAMITFAATVGHYVSDCILYAATLEGQIMAATTAAAAQAVVITTGWPTS